MKFSLELTNFKQHKELKQDFESGNIYVVGGPNDIGKTHFLEAIKVIATGVPGKKNNVSFGESEGTVKGEIEFDSAKGKKYIVKWDFTEDKNKFIIIDPETNVHKSTSRNNIIAELFQYNMFTIDEWFGWGLTSEGRKKQAEIILNLLPQEARDEFLSIEADVNPSFGNKFKERTEINKDYDAAKKLLDNSKLSDEDKAKIDKWEKGLKLTLQSLKDSLEEELKSDKSSKKEKLETLKKSMSEAMDEDLLIDEKFESEAQEVQNEIQRLQNKLVTMKEGYKTTKKRYKEKIEAMDIMIESLEEEINKDSKEKVDINVLKERIAKGETYKEEVTKLLSIQETYELNVKKAQELRDKSEKLTETIEKLRERKKAIIEENKLPVDNISIEDGECLYIDKDGNTMPFVKDAVSYAKGGMTIIRLMAHLNKELPIWLVGSAESYDKNRLEELHKIVEEYNGIMFLDKVIFDAESLTIECLEK